MAVQPVIAGIDANYLKETYLFGIDLQDSNGNIMTDDAIQRHINNAFADLEHKLGVRLRRTFAKGNPIDDGLVIGDDYDIEQKRMPFHIEEARSYFKIQLPHNNIKTVDRIRAYIRGNLIWTFDPNDFVLEYLKAGVIHILPRSFVGFSGSPGVFSGIYGDNVVNTSFIPDFWSIDYSFGLDVPDPELTEWACLTACLVILPIASTAKNPGIASQTISYDGLTRTVNTTASAIYNLYSSQEDSFRKRVQQIDLPAKKQRLRGLKVYSV